MKARLLGLLALAVGLMLVPAGTANAVTLDDVAADSGKLTPNPVPIRGPVEGGGTFNGKFEVQRFEQDGTQLVAVGRVTGTLKNTTEGTKSVDVQKSIPVAATTRGGANPLRARAARQCQILDLVINPIRLDLLGLVVSLDRVHLNITAVSGQGNLLGNLLCALAGLLDPQNPGGLAAALNKALVGIG